MSTTSDILELSHSINANSAGKKPVGRPKGSRANSDDERSAPLPPRPAAVKLPPVDKKAVAEAEAAAEDRERAETIRRVNSYLDSPVFGPKLAELDLKKFRGNESLPVAREALERIKATMGMAYKRVFVNRLWDLSGQTIGAIGERMFKLEHFAAFPEALDGARPEFEQELEEIAIEMSSDLVPSAKTRLVMKAMSFVFEYDKACRQGGVPPAPTGRRTPPEKREVEDTSSSSSR